MTTSGADVTVAPFAWGTGLDDLLKSKVTQCALSRICGGCGEALTRPVTFLGTPAESDRNAFHNPPMHASCAEVVRTRADADAEWLTVLTSGFEFVRASKQDVDKRPIFQLNSVISS